MKKHFSTLAIGFVALTILSNSCTPERSDDPIPAVSTCRVSAIKDINDSTALTYDAQNRVTKMAFFDEDGTPVEYETYTYSPGKITVQYFDDTQTPDGSEEYILNTNGTVNYIARSSSYGPNVRNDTLFHTYDSEGHNTQVKSKTVVAGPIMSTSYDFATFTYSNGNMIQSKNELADGEVYIVDYTYTTLVDKNHVFDGAFMIPGLYGTGSKNLVESGSNDDATYSEDYIYEVNANGYVTRMKSTIVDVYGTHTSDKKYTYFCY
jgi:hypothetical protein